MNWDATVLDEGSVNQKSEQNIFMDDPTHQVHCCITVLVDNDIFLMYTVAA